MTSAVRERRKNKAQLTQCAVFKVDRKGRFVFVDDLTEKILAAKCEDLYVKDIQDFLDESSRTALVHILECDKTYETFYRPLVLVIRDTNGGEHRHTAVVSLNFVAGNPANYQIVLIPETLTPTERIEVVSQTSEVDSVQQKLFEYVAVRHDNEVDWETVAGILLELPSVRQVTLYRVHSGDLIPLASSSRRPHSGTGIDSKQYDKDMFASVSVGETFAREYPADQRDPEFGAELACPLGGRDHIWGCIRFIHCNEYPALPDEARLVVDFIGTALAPPAKGKAAENTENNHSSLLHQSLTDLDHRLDALANLSAFIRDKSVGILPDAWDRIANAVTSELNTAAALTGAAMTMTSVNEISITEQVDLNRVFRDVYGILEAEFPRKTISLDTANLPVLAGDEDKIRKSLYYVLYCLLALHDDYETVQLNLGAEIIDNVCRLGVHSPSAGIDGAHPERLFADDDREGDDEISWHCRIMMTVARTIARQMRGDIKCSPDDRSGVTLVLSFAVSGGSEGS